MTARITILYNKFENYYFKITASLPHFPGANELISCNVWPKNQIPEQKSITTVTQNDIDWLTTNACWYIGYLHSIKCIPKHSISQPPVYRCFVTFSWIYLAKVGEWVIKSNGLSGDSGQPGPYSPYKPCNHSLYIGIIIFPHIDLAKGSPDIIQITWQKQI